MLKPRICLFFTVRSFSLGSREIHLNGNFGLVSFIFVRRAFGGLFCSLVIYVCVCLCVYEANMCSKRMPFSSLGIRCSQQFIQTRKSCCVFYAAFLSSKIFIDCECRLGFDLFPNQCVPLCCCCCGCYHSKAVVVVVVVNIIVPFIFLELFGVACSSIEQRNSLLFASIE